MKYRMRPIIVDAFRWTGDTDQTKDPEWIVEAIETHKITFTYAPLRLRVHTLEGTMTADPGDWIVRVVKDEIYPCKPEVFKATYEPAED